jgi:3',5'-cyclic AMP phosphodiesterase CpdA
MADAETKEIQPELTSVGPDFAVVHEGAEVRTFDGLTPNTDYELGGFTFRTLPVDGEQLARIATVNDVHFGETECGHIEGDVVGPILRSEPGEDPYPEIMNRGAVDEIAGIAPDAVVAKGDLTSTGSVEEYERFLEVYAGAFGNRLHHVRGNHDASHGERFADCATQRIDVPGATVALLDTAIDTWASGQITDDQIDWLDALAADADRPVLVMGHHHCWSPDSNERNPYYFGISPDDSEKLVDVVRRRPSIVGYFAGHTHRNRRRVFSQTGEVPYVEVASVKDYPGSWAEYRVHERGIVQIHHRISTPEALDWTNRTRAMFGGAYPWYAFGELDDRCFALPSRRVAVV